MKRGLWAGLLALAVPLRADVVVLTDGDRVTGQIVAKGTRRVRVQTPYGLLVIPRDKIERIRKDDGTEEVLSGPLPSPPPPPPPPSKARLVMVVTGTSFWQAWDPRTAPPDPSLRLEVQIDGRSLGAYRDPVLDPGDLPKATVNTFSFLPDSVARESRPGVTLLPPDIKLGRIELPLELPADATGRRRLRLAYQANEGTFDDPRWTDLVEASVELEIAPAGQTALRLEQSRGAMEFVKRHMKGVETFVMRLDTPPPGP